MSTTAEANIEVSDLSYLVGKKVILKEGVPCLSLSTPAISGVVLSVAKTGVVLSVAKNGGVLYYVVQFDAVQPTPLMTPFFQNLKQQFDNIAYVYYRFVAEAPAQG
jgi:hypothetical protein